GIVSEINTDKYKVVAFQPACDTSSLTIKRIVDAMEERGANNVPVGDSQELKKLSESLGIFNDIVEKSPANILLKDL
ncbi:hypothetical protein ACFL2G_00430, partial [Candidatus Omnitrophota bacterium]